MSTIAVCTFLALKSKEDSPKLEPSSDKPYTYYNPEQLPEGSLALVAAGSGYGLVRIARNLAFADLDPAKLTLNNILLAPVTLNLSDVALHFSHLRELKAKLGSANVQKEIDNLLKKK